MPVPTPTPVTLPGAPECGRRSRWRAALLSTVLAFWAVAGMVAPDAAAGARVSASRPGVVTGARLVGAAPRLAGRSPASPVGSPVPAFDWPMVGPPSVVRPFSPPPQPWLPGHRGVDLGAAAGVLVLAAGAGTVHFAGWVAGTGVVSIDHANGLRTTYEPVLPLVHAGQTVRTGDPIGVLQAGHPGCPAPACLHWGLRRGSDYLDPLSLLGRGRVRLLPLSAPPLGEQGR
jgi:murein DD-endopeptidase MepM/ murein hydrolase activator NlpD